LYAQLGRGARARDYENALQWLVDAGLVVRCCRISAGRLPLSAYVEDGAFKLFALDVGILGAMAELSPATLVQGEGVFTAFKGAFVENYVAQSLRGVGIKPYYWHSEGKAEVDFVVENRGKVVPIDAKAGVNVRSRSLGVFIDTNKVNLGVRMSLRNFERHGVMMNIPLYAAGNIMSLLEG
jgi:predicted AAA+ superfamily ATPase